MEIFALETKSCTLVLGLVTMIAAAALMGGAGAQEVEAATPACASKLLPCGQYLNGTETPPKSCCGPLKEAVTQEMACLCAIFNSPEILKAFSIDVSQALSLPARCGFSSDPNACSKSHAAAPSTSPPATPGGNSSAGRNGATWFGVSVFLLWWSIMV